MELAEGTPAEGCTPAEVPAPAPVPVPLEPPHKKTKKRRVPLESSLLTIATLKTTRKICSFFKKSPKSLKALKNFQEMEGLKGRKLKKDVPTRWNSTLTMIESVLENQVFFFFFFFFFEIVFSFFIFF